MLYPSIATRLSNTYMALRIIFTDQIASAAKGCLGAERWPSIQRASISSIDASSACIACGTMSTFVFSLVALVLIVRDSYAPLLDISFLQRRPMSRSVRLQIFADLT